MFESINKIFDEYEKRTGETIAERAERLRQERKAQPQDEERTPEEIEEDEFWEKAAIAGWQVIWKEEKNRA